MPEFFRIISDSVPTLAHFRPIGTTGRRLRFPQYRREFEEGVSVYDSFEPASAMARAHHFRHGTYAVRIVLPEVGPVEFRQTFADHHFTIYARPEEILAYADPVALRIPGAPGD